MTDKPKAGSEIDFEAAGEVCECCGLVAAVDEEWPYKTCWPPGWTGRVCGDPLCVAALAELKLAEKQHASDYLTAWMGSFSGYGGHHAWGDAHPKPTIRTRVRR